MENQRNSSTFGPLGESWRAWLALAVGVLAVTAHSASSIVFSILMKPILSEFGWNRADFAAAMNLRILLMIGGMFIAGQLTDRLGPRTVLACGALIVGLGTSFMAAVESLFEFRVVMASLGPGQAAIGSIAASALVLRQFHRRRGLAIGILNGGDNIINSLVPYATGGLLASFGWRGAINGVSITYLCLAALIYFVLSAKDGAVVPDAKRGLARDGAWTGIPWTDPRLWFLLASYTLTYSFITSLQLHLHAFQTDLGRTATQASTVLSTQLLVGAIGSPLFGWLAERFPPRRTLVGVLCGLTLSSVLLWSLESYEAFLAWAVFHGLINGGIVALLTLVLNELFGAQAIGRLMGLAMFFCMSATMIGNQFTAATFDQLHTYGPVWQRYTFIMLLAVIPAAILSLPRFANRTDASVQ